MKLIQNSNEKKYEIGNFSEELNRMAEKIVVKPKVEKNGEGSLEQKLSYDNEGKPCLKLNGLKGTFVHTETQKAFDYLMQVFECGNWTYADFNSLPTEKNCYISLKENTSIYASEKFFQYPKNMINEERYKVIRTTEFYKIQGITPRMRVKIESWFEKNKPGRASKGK